MAIIKLRPLTPSQRFTVKVKSVDSTENNPVRALTISKHRSKGRNCYGRITSRRRGGGHKRLLRVIDFKRDKYDIEAHVQKIEYDPNRSANIALIAYADGLRNYILAPEGLKVGDVVVSKNVAPEDFDVGLSLPLNCIPLGLFVHCVELTPGSGAKIVRSAGAKAQLTAIEGDRATLRLPSGEIRMVNSRCRATIGTLGNSEHNKIMLGKAGRNRWLGRRPRVRGVAMNPVDHPMGGGEGKTSGGGHPVSPWGQLSKGLPTRRRSKNSNSMIIVRCNGRKVRKG